MKENRNKRGQYLHTPTEKKQLEKIKELTGMPYNAIVNDLITREYDRLANKEARELEEKHWCFKDYTNELLNQELPNGQFVYEVVRFNDYFKIIRFETEPDVKAAEKSFNSYINAISKVLETDSQLNDEQTETIEILLPEMRIEFNNLLKNWL